MLQATLPFLTPPTESYNRPEVCAGKARLHTHTHPAITKATKFATMGFLPLLPLPCEGAIGVMPMAAMYHSEIPSAIGAPKGFISHLKSHALPLLPAGCTIYQAPVPLRAPPRYYDEEDYEDDDDDEDFDDDASVFSMLSTGSSASTAPDDEEPPFEATDDTTGETITVYTSLEQAARYSAARAERERRSQEDALLVAMPPSPAAGITTASPVASLFHFFPAVPGAVAAPAPTYDADDIDEDAYFSMG